MSNTEIKFCVNCKREISTYYKELRNPPSEDMKPFVGITVFPVKWHCFACEKCLIDKGGWSHHPNGFQWTSYRML